VQVQGLSKGKRIRLVVKSNRIIKGQIRLLERDGQLEIHSFINLGAVPKAPENYQRIIGVDKGYTEAFVSSEGQVYGKNLGTKITAKTERINSKNKKRQKLWGLASKYQTSDPQKAQSILENNLTRKAENKKLQRDKAEIKSLIRHGVRQILQTPTLVYAEDLSKHFITKKQSKAVNRKLNSWVKGELQKSLESIAQLSRSKIEIVNPAYTSQVDHLTGTLLGFRDGDSMNKSKVESRKSKVKKVSSLKSKIYNTSLNLLKKYMSLKLSQNAYAQLKSCT